MDGNKTFKALILGAAIFTLTLVTPLKEATASTVQGNCVNVANVTMKVAEFRDVGVPPKIVVNQLIEAGLDIDTAVRLAVWVYSKQQADPAALGQWAYSFCMADAGEPV